jgi:nucleoside-diphosphate-sugar epimerase
VDRAAPLLLMDAAEQVGVRRFLHVSSINVGCADNPDISEGYATYLRAKRAAEQHIMAREGLDWTLLRPGVLTDDPGAGTVQLTAGHAAGSAVARFDLVSRDDVAAVLVALLDRPGTAGRAYVLVGGETPIDQALTSVNRCGA